MLEGRAFVSVAGGRELPVVVGAVDEEWAEVSGVEAGKEVWVEP